MVVSSLLKGTVTEDAASNTVGKTLAITGVDSPTFTEQADRSGTYGSFRITSAGVWTYTLDNSAGGATDKLNGTEAPKKTDVFTIMAADGTSGTVTITITGVDDPSTLSGGFEGSVTEDNTTNFTATGEITVADVDTTPIPTITAQTNKAGTYGSFTIGKKNPSDEADRVYSWTYTLDDADDDTNALTAGTIVEDEFTITTSDGVNAKVTITITGADDSSTIGGGLSGSVTEDDSANLTAEGTATITDEDSDATFIAQTDTAGSYGTFSITAAGDWTYSLDNSPGDTRGDATNALKAGQTESETFPITTSDGNSVNVTITVNGANDAAVFGKTGLTGSIGEDAAPNTVTGTATSTDVDGDDNKFTAVTAPDPVSGSYGSLTITEDGAWTYSLDNSNATVNALGQGAPLTDSLTIQAKDGTEGTITITITGVNDKSSIDVTGSGGSVTEDDTANATVRGTFTLTDPDTIPLPTITRGTQTGTYGQLVIAMGTPGTNDGEYTWTYTLDNDDSDTNALTAGATVTDTFTIAASDNGEAMVTISITGANDPATFSGLATRSGAVTEDAISKTATANITVSDVDGANALKEQADQTGIYGSLSVDHSAGTWTYTLTNSGDNAQARATQALAGGARATETFTILAADDTPTTLTITITGVNDAAVFGTTGLTGSITEDAAPNTVTDTVTSTDVDGEDNKFTAVTAPASVSGTYGSLTITEDGAWTYSLDNSNATVNALGQGATLTDSLTIQTADGTAETITITITGANDAATFSGPDTRSGAVTEDATSNTATGTITVTDVDGANALKEQANQTGSYGSLSVDHSAGTWTYTLTNSGDNARARATQALADEETATETFTILAADDTETMVTITITGVNDAAVFGTTGLTGSITEDAAPNTVTDTVTSTDVDGEDNKFTAVTAPASVSGTYGSLTITEDGAWTYSLDNSNATVNALGQGATLTDSLTIQTADGTAETITITITGANDAATFSGTQSGAVTEDATVNTATSTITVSDVDGDNALKQQADQTGSYGNLSVNHSTGVWTYTLTNSGDNARARATQALAGGATATETFTILAADDTPTTLTITITGANDAATIGGAVTGAISEGTASTTGTVTSTDVDGTDNAFRTEVSPNDGTTLTTGTGDYGTLTITSAGAWTYTLDNSAGGATDLLAGGATAPDAFTIMAADGTSGTVTITITGVNDDATIGGDTTGSITEGTASTTGTVTSTDPDGDNNVFKTEVSPNDGTTLTTGTGDYGTLTITSAGVWTYTLDNSPGGATDLLAGDATATDAFTIMVADGTSGMVTITITGVNDDATIGGDTTGSITEGTASTTGTVTSTDPDGDNNVFKTEVSPNDGTTLTTGTGDYGTLTITSAGVWTYTLDNSPGGATDLLAGDATATDAFTIMAADGTSGMVTITITGVSDDATIGGDTTGSITEGTASTTGTVTSTDPDGDNNVFKTEVSPNDGTTLTTGTGDYGTLTITSAGVWTYTLDNSPGGATDLLAGDATATDAFTIMAADGTSGMVTITITGVSDDATIGGDTTGSITEGTASTTGTVTSTDPDGDNNVFKTEVSPNDGTTLTTGTGDYGTLTITSAGVWTYTLDNSPGGATDLLAGDATATDAFTIMAADGTSGMVTITITGVNDDATIGGDTTGSITEGTASTTGTVTSTDPDGDNNVFKTEVSPNDGTTLTTGTGDYGTLTITSAGVWTYTLDNSPGGATDLLAGDATATDAFTIMVADGTSGTVTITITGVNDAAVFGTTGLTGAITEGTASTTGTVTSTDVDGTDNSFKTEVSPTTGTYGSLTITTAGAWTYTLDNSAGGATDLLDGTEDPKKTDVFTIMAADGTEAMVTITITGVNDAATFGGTSTGSVMEDGTLTASGSVTVADVDGDDALKEQADQTSIYGSLSVDHSTGNWTYTLNNDAAAVQALTGGARGVPDSFTIMAADGTEATVTITITGAIDPGDIAGATGSVTEDDTLKARARGRVIVDGVSDATFTAQTNVSRTYGTFNLEANGNWTYDLDNSRSATNALDGGDEETDTLEIATADGSATATLTITVTGNDDRSTIDTDKSDLTGSVTEDVTGTATGTVRVADVDRSPDPAIKERSDVSGAYGTFRVTSAGVWTYTLSNSAAAVQALTGEDRVTEDFKIETVDGAEAVITITITGTDDPNEIEGTVTGSVTEDDEEASSASGTVTVTGSTGATFAVKAMVPPQSQTYGTFTIQSDGNWTYTLTNSGDNARARATQALAGGQTETETITIEASLEGNTAVEKDVTITITGVNDAATIGGVLTGDITEGTASTPDTVTGTATVTDVDGDDSFSTEVTPAQGIYGSLTLTSAGKWTYTLNNADPDTNALTAGQEVTDSFTIEADDGTETAVTITVTGVTDRDEIEGDVSGSVREAAGDEDDQAMASGRVRVADDPAARFTVQENKVTTYGTFSLTEEGDWTYRLNNDRVETDALGQGEIATDPIIIEATASDNTPRTATVTITVIGSEVGGDLTGSIRDGSRTPVVGKLTTEQGYDIVDVEDIRPGKFGCLRVRSDGSWTYWLYGTDDDDLCPRPIEALAQSGTVTALAAEQARMDVFMIEVVRKSDGMVTNVRLTITIEEAAAPVTRTDAVTGYLQGRAEVLLGKQPELVQFLKNLRSGITSEGQVSVDVRDGALMGFDGSFVRDGLWGALSVARSEQGSGKTEQIFGTLGYHGQVADAAFVGLMLQFDQADGELDAGLGSIDGQGWLFGPYFAAQYQAQQPWISPLTLEGRLLYGPTRNDVGFVDGGTGTFDTQRWLASFRLEGEVLLDYDDRAIRLIPHFDAGWVQDKVEAFTDSEEMQVAGQTIRFSEVALGSDIEVPVRFGQREAVITGGLSLVSTREQSQGQNARVSVSDTHGRLELGLGYRLANGIELEFGGSYDDVEGANSEDKFSLSFGLSSQF